MKKIDTCLSCHKPISDSGPLDGYHPACSRKLFGTPKPPKISKAVLKRLGDAPIFIGETNLAACLPEAYEVAGRAALQKAAEYRAYRTR